jgi:ribosomal protein S18 acetylase RimI-like enzyme
MLNYTIEHQWEERSSQAVMEGLKTFNAGVIGRDHPRKLADIVRDDDGRVVAGVLGETKWDWMYIAWLWVDESYRMKGIGKQLMQHAECEGKAMGCHNAHLTTLDFQAKAFYEKLGYTVFAALEDYPQGHTRFLMKKGIG